MAQFKRVRPDCESTRDLPFVICHLPFVICHLPFVICHPPFDICHLPFVICRPPFVICHLTSVIYHFFLADRPRLWQARQRGTKLLEGGIPPVPSHPLVPFSKRRRT